MAKLKIDYKKDIEDLFKSGKTVVEISEKYNVGENTVRRFMKKHRIETGKSQKLFKEHLTEIKNLLNTSSYKEISEKYDVTVPTLFRFLEKYGVDFYVKSPMRVADDFYEKIYEEILKLKKEGERNEDIVKILGITSHHLDKICKKYKIRKFQRFKLSDKHADDIRNLYDKNLSVEEIGKLYGICSISMSLYMKRNGISVTGNKRFSILKEQDKDTIETLYSEGKNSTEIARIKNISNTTVLKFMRNNHIKIRTNGECRREFDEDPQKIKEMYDNGSSIKEIANLYGKKPHHVCNFMKRNNIKVASSSEIARSKAFLKQKDKKFIEDMYKKGISIEDISNELSVSSKTVNKFMNNNKIKIRTYSEASKISEKFKISQKNKKYFSWNKGLTMDDERIRNSIQKGIRTKIKNGTLTTRPRRGYRKDLGHYVRSSWEANFSRILIALNVEYEYEKHHYKLSNGDIYIPDFYIPSKNKYYEIKGWENSDKHLRFAKEYPNKNFTIIYQKQYDTIMKKLSHHISIEDKESLRSKKDIITLFEEYCDSICKRPSISEFLKINKMSQSTINYMFESFGNFFNDNIAHIVSMYKTRLKETYIDYKNKTGVYPDYTDFTNIAPYVKTFLIHSYGNSFLNFKKDYFK